MRCQEESERKGARFGMRLLSIAEASERWGVSKFTTRRLIDAGYVRSVNISARRLIPEDEVARVLREGAGNPRPRRRGASHAQLL
jgi:excisionase family DNA binding protein